MANQELFQAELIYDPRRTILDVTSPYSSIPIDQRSRDAMIAIQKELLQKYKKARLLIDIGPFQVENVDNVFEAIFIHKLTTVSRQFDKLFVYGGPTAALARVIGFANLIPGLEVKVTPVISREDAITKARQD